MRQARDRRPPKVRHRASCLRSLVVPWTGSDSVCNRALADDQMEAQQIGVIMDILKQNRFIIKIGLAKRKTLQKLESKTLRV